MGSWNETCGFSNLPVPEFSDVRFMLIKETKVYGGLRGPFSLYNPASVLVKCRYDSYGWVDGFAEGEEERLTQSASFLDAEAYADGIDRDSLPDDVFPWMMREDVYQMLDHIELASYGDSPKTIGDYIALQRVEYAKIKNALSSGNPFDRITQNYNLYRFFKIGQEEPSLGLTKYFYTTRIDDATNQGGDNISDRRKNAEGKAEQSIVDRVDDHLDFVRLHTGMNCMRKLVTPTSQGGPQWDVSNGYELLANIMHSAYTQCKKEMAEYDE